MQKIFSTKASIGKYFSRKHGSVIFGFVCLFSNCLYFYAKFYSLQNKPTLTTFFKFILRNIQVSVYLQSGADKSVGGIMEIED